MLRDPDFVAAGFDVTSQISNRALQPGACLNSARFQRVFYRSEFPECIDQSASVIQSLTGLPCRACHVRETGMLKTATAAACYFGAWFDSCNEARSQPM